MLASWTPWPLMTSRPSTPSALTLHGCFHRRADAPCERVDALLAAESVAPLPHLSQRAAHQRGWGSVYDVLAEDGVETLRGSAQAAS
jgi:hypothetical protein